MKVCSKYSKVSIQENDVVKCGGWYENSKEKNSCTYWIHKNINCCQTVSNVKYCPNCYHLHQSNISNDNSSREMNKIFVNITLTMIIFLITVIRLKI